MIDWDDASHVKQQVFILIYDLILRGPHLDPDPTALPHHRTAEHHAQPVLEYVVEIRLVEEHDFHGTRFILNRHREQSHVPSSRPPESGMVDGSGYRGFFLGNQLRNGHNTRTVFIPPG